MDKLTLVIPAKHEKESLPLVLEELQKYHLKTIVVLEKEDHDTIFSISKFDCKILYQNNKGYGDALIQGIRSVETDYFCIFNADGSFEHKDLFKMYELMLENDFVYTTRYEVGGGSEDDTIITYIGNKFFSKLGNILFSLKISDILYTYLMGRTSSYKSLGVISNDFTCDKQPSPYR